MSFINNLDPNDYVFPNPKDKSKPLPINKMYNHHRKLLICLGLVNGYTLYSWKHTGAVAVAKKGLPFKQLQLQLRHHSLNETDKYLRQMGVNDMDQLKEAFPVVWE